LIELVDIISGFPETQVKNIALLFDEQKEWMSKRNQIDVEYKNHTNLYDSFTQKVKDVGTQTALCFKNKRLSYSELFDCVENWASVLNEKVNPASSFIGIMTAPSDYMITAVLTILSLSGAFVPVDPDWPREREMRPGRWIAPGARSDGRGSPRSDGAWDQPSP
jgi:non-ribosomal peptide synthetase component F